MWFVVCVLITFERVWTVGLFDLGSNLFSALQPWSDGRHSLAIFLSQLGINVTTTSTIHTATRQKRVN